MVLYPLHKAYKAKKVLVSTYQAASGAGKEGMEELQGDMENYPQNPGKPKVFAHQLMSNLIPHIDKFQDNLYLWLSKNCKCVFEKVLI